MMRALLFALALLAQPQEPSEIEALVRKLESAEIEARDAAVKALLAKGEAARAALDRAAAGQNKAIAVFARSILENLDRRIDVLGAALERIRTRTSPSYQRYLRDAKNLVQEAVNGKEAGPLIASLLRQGMIETKDWTPPQTAVFVARQGAYVSTSGLRHDLVLSLDVRPLTSKTEPTKWIVQNGSVSLIARPKVPFESVDAKTYPDESAVRQALEHESIRTAAVSYPVLEEIEIRYEQLSPSRWYATRYWGFSVNLRLVTRDDTAGSAPGVYFRSGLDPVEPAEAPGFVAADTIEFLWSRDGSRWSRTVSESVATSGWSTLRRSDCPAEPSTEVNAAVVWGAGDLAALPADVSAVHIKGATFEAADCEGLIRLANLWSLEWSMDAKIPDSAYAHLGRLKSLESLELISHSEPTDECFEQLAELVHLQRFRVATASRITDRGIAALAGLPELAEVTLHWCSGMTDEGLGRLAGLKNLTSLRLWGSAGITDAGLERLSKSATLRSLTISHSKSVSATGLAHLQKTASLRSLSLGCFAIDDEALVVISKIGGLEDVELQYLDRLTDAGLLHLKSLRNLKRLHKYSCKGLTKEGAQALQAALPGKYALE